jgi:homoserine O-acetyltransferase
VSVITIATEPATEGVLHVPRGLGLHLGGRLEDLRIAWRLTGEAGLPVVVALGGISASRHVHGLHQGQRGWWHEVVGPGKALDTRHLRILGMDFLGGSHGSTHPVRGEAFPRIASMDQAEALALLLDHLQLPRIRAVVGASYGGMVALAFGQRHPGRVERLVVISAADGPHPMATAWRSVQRAIVRFGLQTGEPAQGMQIARALAMSTYRSPEEFSARFRGPPRINDAQVSFPVEDYLYARGRDYAARYLPESYLCLSESIDLHQVDASAIPVPAEVVAVREDQLVPLADMRALAARLPAAQLHEVSSVYGHDAFLKEAEQLKPVLAILARGDLPETDHD